MWFVHANYMQNWILNTLPDNAHFDNRRSRFMNTPQYDIIETERIKEEADRTDSADSFRT